MVQYVRFACLFLFITNSIICVCVCLPTALLNSKNRLGLIDPMWSDSAALIFLLVTHVDCCWGALVPLCLPAFNPSLRETWNMELHTCNTWSYTWNYNYKLQLNLPSYNRDLSQFKLNNNNKKMY